MGIKTADVWIGISVDECDRAKPADVKWIRHIYPLLDLKIRRKDCEGIIRDAGLPMPNKSSCWMCPYRGPREWAALTDGDRLKAELFDKAIRKVDPDVFIHRSGISLSEVSESGNQESLFGGCDSGYCWT